VRYLLLILLSGSLYSPDILRLVAYADYALDALSENKVNICDCADVLQENEETPHEQHSVIIKDQLTYIQTDVYTLSAPVISVASLSGFPTNDQPVGRSYDIFQPPKA
jgi:hypothetical protein